MTLIIWFRILPLSAKIFLKVKKEQGNRHFCHCKIHTLFSKLWRWAALTVLSDGWHSLKFVYIASFLTVLHCKDMPAAIKPRDSWFWPENKNIKEKKFFFVVLIYILACFYICSCVWIEVCIYIVSMYIYKYIHTYMCIHITNMCIKPSLSLLHSPSGLGDPAAWQAPLRRNIIKWRTRRTPWALFRKITVPFTIYHPEQRVVQTSF